MNFSDYYRGLINQDATDEANENIDSFRSTSHQIHESGRVFDTHVEQILADCDPETRKELLNMLHNAQQLGSKAFVTEIYRDDKRYKGNQVQGGNDWFDEDQ